MSAVIVISPPTLSDAASSAPLRSTYYGSEVIHPFTMEQAIRKKVPIRIKNVENPGGSGTVILPDSDEGEKDHLVEGHVAQPQTPMTSGTNTPAVPWGASSTSYPGLDLNAALNPPQRRLPTAVTIKVSGFRGRTCGVAC